MNYVCACGATPNAQELTRIESDLATQPTADKPAGWHCPTCAPALQEAPSGLFWGVVEVVGSSPEHGYES